jgi:hypothetical protein
MQTDDAVNQMKQAALEAANLVKPLEDTPDTRAAFARGVRAMAGLVHACIHVADDTAALNNDNRLAAIMLRGYAQSLRMIVAHADDLIPPGYEP